MKSTKVCKIKIYYDETKQMFYAVSNLPEKDSIVSVGRTGDEFIKNFDERFKRSLNDKVDRMIFNKGDNRE